VTALRYGISDTLVLAKRSLLRIPRQPDLLVGFTVQPILFILLFVYVLGGAIQTPGFDYVDFLMPGIIVQSIAFGGFVTALGLADDLKKGLMDRFRSLPMTRSALLTGRTLGDVATNIFQLVVMFTVGLLIGFNFSGSAGEVVGGIVGVRLHRPLVVVAGGLERVRVHDPLPGHVRLVGVRAGRFDAELAAADRRAQPIHVHGECGPGALSRHPGRQRCLARAALDAGDHRRLRAAFGVALPARRGPMSRRRPRRLHGNDEREA
jgi:ABC-2 family transporter